MITLQDVTLRRGPHILLENVNWTIFHQQHIGIIGANGTGKSTLFAMLLNELQPDSGNLEIPRRLKLAHVAQETPALAISALDFVLDGDEELRTLEKELAQAESTNDGHAIAMIYTRLGEIDAYTAPSRAAQLLNGLGFNHQEQQHAVSAFSGGWRVRLNLAKALMSRSDVLLLDEPTNHLDLDAVIWLENWLKQYQGTLLLISHDREFLDQVVDHIAHLSQQQLKLYTGNYSNFEKQRASQLLLQQAAYEKQQKHLAHLQSFVNRFRAKASKAAQAQSRLKAIAKMELIDAVSIDSPFHFSFQEPKKCPNPLITLDNAQVAYGDKSVLRHLNFQIAPKDRIALLGPNGAGKSSLIKLLAAEITAASGFRTQGEGLRIGYFAQHQVDHLNLEETPLSHLRQIATNVKEQDLRRFLGSFGFVGNRVLEPIKNFSGGEKSRLALSYIVWDQPNLLLLDEPTNHLDLDMRHALSMALQDYQGAMILVSHDRFLVRTTVDQLMLVANQEIQNFTGDLDAYEKWLIDFRKQEQQSSSPSRKPAPKSESRRAVLQLIEKLEKELHNLQTQLTEIETLLLEQDLYLIINKNKLEEQLTKQSTLLKKIKIKEEEWLAANDKLT